MTDRVWTEENEAAAQEFFGACPICHQSSRDFPIGKVEYMVCHDHRLYWLRAVGGGPRDMPEAEQRERESLLDGYERVEPWDPNELTEAQLADAETYLDLDDELDAMALDDSESEQD
jgi:hypothetical protein